MSAPLSTPPSPSVSSEVAISAFAVLPLGEEWPDDHGLDDQHDLVAVGVVGAELSPLFRVESALEQHAQDRRVDLRPVERRCPERDLDLGLLQWQGGVIVEQPAVEPRDRLEADQAAGRHRAEQAAGHTGELVRPK